MPNTQCGTEPAHEDDFRIVFIQLSKGWRYWAFGPDGWDCLWGLDPNGYPSRAEAEAAVANAFVVAAERSSLCAECLQGATCVYVQTDTGKACK